MSIIGSSFNFCVGRRPANHKPFRNGCPLPAGSVRAMPSMQGVRRSGSVPLVRPALRVLFYGPAGQKALPQRSYFLHAFRWCFPYKHRPRTHMINGKEYMKSCKAQSFPRGYDETSKKKGTGRMQCSCRHLTGLAAVPAQAFAGSDTLQARVPPCACEKAPIQYHPKRTRGKTQ